MRAYKLFLILLFPFFAIAQNGRSLEVTSLFGMPVYTSFDKIDNALVSRSYPALVAKLDKGNGLAGGGEFIFRFNRWGIKLGTLSANLSSSSNQDGHYYSGENEYTTFGVTYDVIANEIFTFTPYFGLGHQESEIYLDYEFKNSVTPTSLHIQGKEADFTFGGKFYFRVYHSNDKRFKIYLNADVFYKISYSNKWRFDNMLIKSKDFDLSTLGVLGGVTLRYDF
ncbi:hypothetical protein CGC49_01645 [Capnocytophaga sp. H4358]|uniref:hypothetical protein n=1 Tax=Capnocytophaga sp. H4358 TaxID=1945658 RepID=UPI000BB1746C|nr:hypothetical protein [Capnocytophaga sp. H4358]ATA72127.1 hypothetical protein CGC49_01645 [Capnocytophaga sp. H4358]